MDFTLFQPLASWLVEPKIGGHNGAAKTALQRHWLYYSPALLKIKSDYGRRDQCSKPPKISSLGHFRAVKQSITVVLDMGRRRVDPVTFQSI